MPSLYRDSSWLRSVKNLAMSSRVAFLFSIRMLPIFKFSSSSNFLVLLNKSVICVILCSHKSLLKTATNIKADSNKYYKA